ncbi:hypothetical protein [Streptomyces collinus]|uniref:hypothetical protein n=1 Tax=Streptomyces collinus TaxID=42684 RepID=UPI0029429625|nr:hypothetical protein [Streptomyces collinus]
MSALAGVDFIHAAFGQVAAGEGGPFVVHLEEHGGDQPQEPVAVGGAGLGVLCPLGADPGRVLGLGQFLQHPLGHTPHEFESVRRT